MSSTSSAMQEIEQSVGALVTALGQASEVVPVLKSVFGSIQFVVESVRLFRSNREEWKNLADFLLRLCKGIKTLTGDNWKVETSNLELMRELEEILGIVKSIQEKVAEMQKRSTIKAALQTWDDKNTINGFRQSLDDVLRSFVFVHVAGISRRLEKQRISPSAPEPPALPTSSCPRSTGLFTGREEVIAKLLAFFDPIAATRGPRIFVLTGLGGIGKTQIAYRFSELVQREDSPIRIESIYFVDASSEESISTSLKSIAIAKKWGDSVEHAKSGLGFSKEPWLMIFDNADNSDVKLQPFFPDAPHGNIIVTSRNVETRALSPQGYYQVPRMDEEDSISLISQCVAKGEDANEIRRLAKTLGYLPLLMVQASAYIVASECNIRQYLTFLEKRSGATLQNCANMAYQYPEYPRTAFAIWDSSFKRLSPKAQTFLKLCSRLHYDGIPQDTFPRASISIIKDLPTFPIPEKPSPGLNFIRNFLAEFCGSDDQWDGAAFLQITREIQQFSFLEINTNMSYSIHPILHEWIREDSKADSEMLVTAAQYLCGFAIDNLSDEEAFRFRRAAVPHVNACVSDSVIVGVSLVLRFCRAYSEVGLFRRAMELCDVVIQVRQATLGHDDLDVTTALAVKARLFVDLGMYQDAERIQREVLDLRVALLGLQHPYTILAMGNLACTYSSLSRYEEAEQIERDVLEIRTNFLGPEHPDTITAMGNLASTCCNLGLFEEAEHMEEEVLALRTRLLGEEHPDTIQTLRNLAVTHHKMGESVKAGILLGDALSLAQTHLGSKHPTTVNVMVTLSELFESADDAERVNEVKKIAETHIPIAGPSRLV